MRARAWEEPSKSRVDEADGLYVQQFDMRSLERGINDRFSRDSQLYPQTRDVEDG
jgi:hypothetical protein